MTATPTLEVGRRERKKAEQRQALQRAALRLAVDRGYDALTVEAIADACDVSPRTFFNYFSSKDEALLGPATDRKLQLSELLSQRPVEEAPLVALRAVCVEFASVQDEDLRDRQARRRLIQGHPVLLPKATALFAELERALTDVMAQRLALDATRDAYPALVVGVAITAMRVAFMRPASPASTDQDLPALVGRMFDVLAAGLPDPRRDKVARMPFSPDPKKDTR